MTRMIQTVTELRERAAQRASGDMAETEFRSEFFALLSRVPPHTIRESACFSLPANRPLWFDTGFTCHEGEDVTVFAAGRAYLSRELDIWLKPSFWLWYRLGEQGNLFRQPESYGCGSLRSVCSSTGKGKGSMARLNFRLVIT